MEGARESFIALEREVTATRVGRKLHLAFTGNSGECQEFLQDISGGWTHGWNWNAGKYLGVTMGRKRLGSDEHIGVLVFFADGEDGITLDAYHSSENPEDIA